jgi:DNA-binding Xre family transcriptional regulator
MLGDELKKLIEESGYNHTQVAEILGMSYQNLFRLYKREYVKSSQLNEIFEKLSINKKVYTDSPVPSNQESEVEHLREQVRILKDLVQAQKELSGSALIETKDKMIRMLEEQVADLKHRLNEKNCNNGGHQAKTA